MSLSAHVLSFFSSKTKRILALSIPIVGGMMSQNILNLVDTLMIGKLGAISLAAAGIGGFLFFVCFSFFTGSATAVQTMVARFKGENNTHLYGLPFYMGLIFVFIFSFISMVIEFSFTDELVRFFSTDANVVTIAADYFRYRIIGLPFLCICLVVRGFFNGISLPMRYLRVILIVHSLNIFLNYCLIYGNFGFNQMEAAGAGLASTVSVIVGTIFYLVDCRTFVSLSVFKQFSKEKVTENFKWMMQLSLPASIQQFLFALGVAGFYWILSCLGTDALAIGNVLVTIVLVGILPGVGLGMATMSLVSESLGKKSLSEMYLWPYDVSKIAIYTLGPLFLLAILFPEPIISLFIVEESIVKKAILPLRLDCIGVFLEVGTLIFMNALNGVDKVKFVMWGAFICQWVIYLPLAYFAGITFGLGMAGVWGMWIVFQVLQVSLFGGFWYYKYRNYV
jgi:multidrug resistance protein, MATE family